MNTEEPAIGRPPATMLAVGAVCAKATGIPLTWR